MTIHEIDEGSSYTGFDRALELINLHLNHLEPRTMALESSIGFFVPKI